MKQAVQVTILGQQYTVKSESPPGEVRQVAAFVNEKICEVKTANKAVDTLNTAILALLNVSADYLRLRKQELVQDSVKGRLRLLVERVDQSLPAWAEDATEEEDAVPGDAGGPLGD